MRVRAPGHPHLTYCTNIHPGETWPEVRANLERYVLAVRGRVAPAEPFGVGLRLSAEAARSLAAPGSSTPSASSWRGTASTSSRSTAFPTGPFTARA